MTLWIKVIGRCLLSFGIDPRKVFRGIVRWPGFIRDIRSYNCLWRQGGRKQFPLRARFLYPILLDKDDVAGNMGAYFHQDLFVARRIFQRRPESHLDIGSRIDGLVGTLLTFMNVTIVDVRPLKGIEGLTCIQAEATDLKGYIENDTIPSLSCLHVLEHFGLGRYGDNVDPSAWRTGLREMARILKPGGIFYVSVPVGEERLEFNAHRVFSHTTLPEYGKTLGMALQATTHITGEGISKTSIVKESLCDQGNVWDKDSLIIYEFTKL